MSPWEHKIVWCLAPYDAGWQLLPLAGTEGWELVTYWDGWALIRRLRSTLVADELLA